jgi:hypothetical protein
LSPTEIASLARQLARVRRALADEAPHSPAWAATVEWVEELEEGARAMGLDPDTLVESLGCLSELRSRRGAA